MKRGLTIIGWLIMMAVATSGCQKDIDIFIPDNTQGPDTTWYNAIADYMPVKALRVSLAPQTHLDSFEVNNNPVTIVSPGGLTCRFPAQCCVTASGQPVTGKVMVQLLLVKKKGDMIAAGKPTASNNRLLVSGGEMFVRLSQNGEELKLAQGKSITLKYEETQPNQGMKVFYGDESNPDRFNWVPADSAGTSALLPVFTGNNFYELTSGQLRWINCDYFYDTTGVNRVQVVASLSPVYTNANTITYLVFNNLRSVLGMYGNAATKKFQSGLVPIGQPVTIVVISKQDNNYFLGKQTIVTSPNTIPNNPSSNQQLINISPVSSSLAEIKAYLATL